VLVLPPRRGEKMSKEHEVLTSRSEKYIVKKLLYGRKFE